MLRYAAYFASLVMTLVCAGLMFANPEWRWGLAVFGLLSVLGTWDLLQTRSTLRRNYPILAHFRYGLESIGPEIRQYFIESDTAEVPFSRQQRALVYQRSKHVMRRACRSAPSTTSTTSTTSGSTIRWQPARSRVARLPRRRSAAQCAASVRRQRVQHLGDEFRLAVGQRDPRAQCGGETRAVSTTTPARARSRPTTARTAATWSGRSARATSAAATTTAASATSASPPMPPIRR